VFCAASAFILYSSVAYAGKGALIGLTVTFAGLPLLALDRRRAASETTVIPESLPA
jgi:basic amino acid/polyamine antiporter, APA family